MAQLLSAAYSAERRARIDPRAYPDCPPHGRIPGFPPVDPLPPTGEVPVGGARAAGPSDLVGTSYIAVMDREGNIFTPSDGCSRGP